MKKQRIVGLVFAALLFFAGMPLWVWASGAADANDCITRHFDVKAKFDNSHSAKIEEHIVVDFKKPHQGIVRDIPTAADRSYRIKNVKVPGFQFVAVMEEDALRLKIGESDVELLGEHEYEISYEVEYYRDDSTKEDHLLQNLLPADWMTPIRKSRLVLVMPKACNWDQVEILFGKTGGKKRDWFGCFKRSFNDKVMTLDGRDIPLHYGLSVRDDHLPEGYWSAAKSYKQANASRFAILYFIIIVSMLLPVLLWLRWGREHVVEETEEHYPPNRLLPAETEYALYETFDDRGLFAMVLYYAQKGYLKIVEVGKGTFDLQMRKRIRSEEPEFSKRLFAQLFEDDADRIAVGQLTERIKGALTDVKDSLAVSFSAMHGRDYTISSQLARYACIGILFVNELLCGFFMGDERVFLFVVPLIFQMVGMTLVYEGYGRPKRHIVVSGLIAYFGGLCAVVFLMSDVSLAHCLLEGICGMVVLFFGLIMPRRNRASVKLLGRLKGFRNFIRRPEKDRLRFLLQEDPAYAYEMLPYAVIFNAETKWMNQFQDIEIGEPQWYETYRDEPFCQSDRLHQLADLLLVK